MGQHRASASFCRCRSCTCARIAAEAGSGENGHSPSSSERSGSHVYDARARKSQQRSQRNDSGMHTYTTMGTMSTRLIKNDTGKPTWKRNIPGKGGPQGSPNSEDHGDPVRVRMGHCPNHNTTPRRSKRGNPTASRKIKAESEEVDLPRNAQGNRKSPWSPDNPAFLRQLQVRAFMQNKCRD